MAVGDIVSDYSTGALTFQPAVGVTVCITQILANTTSGRLRGRGDIDTGSSDLYFGTSDGSTSTNPSISEWNNLNWRWFLTNSSYLYFSSNAGYSGIQTA
jgi:hypothetical protein